MYKIFNCTTHIVIGVTKKIKKNRTSKKFIKSSVLKIECFNKKINTNSKKYLHSEQTFFLSASNVQCKKDAPISISLHCLQKTSIRRNIISKRNKILRFTFPLQTVYF